MGNPWFRLWVEMVNDPKWRTIARVSKQRIGDVISVYLHLMTCASNATERGRTQGWSDEDTATALDLDTEQVTSILSAMQGRVMDGDNLTGWSKRQPVREDGSSERAKAFRDRAKQEKEANRTQPNATERKNTLDKIRGEETRIEEVAPAPSSDESLMKKTKATASREGLRFADWFRTLLPEKLNLAATWRESWGVCYDELLRIDNRTKAEIKTVCDFARHDNFWSSAFMTPLKLRQRDKDGIKYFDVFDAKMRKPRITNERPDAFNTPLPEKQTTLLPGCFQEFILEHPRFATREWQTYQELPHSLKDEFESWQARGNR